MIISKQRQEELPVDRKTERQKDSKTAEHKAKEKEKYVHNIIMIDI